MPSYSGSERPQAFSMIMMQKAGQVDMVIMQSTDPFPLLQQLHCTKLHVFFV